MLKSSINKVDTEALLQKGYNFMRPLVSIGACQTYSVRYYKKFEMADPSGEGATKKKIDKELVCKVFDLDKIPKDYRKFLIRELDVIRKIQNPYIVKLHSIYYRANKFMVFMRHAEKGTMLNYLMFSGPLKEKLARIWFRQVLVAVLYLHTLDIVHRDIKAENVVITAANNVKLCDFGFARFTVDDKDERQMCSTFCGSLEYAPPEILEGIVYDGRKADMWSLGVLLYVMLNARLPFKVKNLTVFVRSQKLSDYKFLPSVEATVSAYAIDLVRELLDPSPKLRPHPIMAYQSKWLMQDPALAELTRKEAEVLEEAVYRKEEKRAMEILARLSNHRRLTEQMESRELLEFSRHI